MVKKIDVCRSLLFFFKFYSHECHPFLDKESPPPAVGLSDPIPFDSYRSMISPSSPSSSFVNTRQLPNRNPPNYAGASRLSDNEDEHETHPPPPPPQLAVNAPDTSSSFIRRDYHQHQSSITPEPYSRTILPSSFIDTSVRANSNTSTLLMMMKGNEHEGKNGSNNHHNNNYEPRTVHVSSSVRQTSSASSSSSSSLPVDEQQQQQQQQQQTQQFRPRGYNFVPAPFNGSRLVAKSTEQLNRSFANDSLVKYCTPPSTPTSSLFQSSTNKVTSPTSILKQNYFQKYSQPSSSMSTQSKLIGEKFSYSQIDLVFFLQIKMKMSPMIK